MWQSGVVANCIRTRLLNNVYFLPGMTLFSERICNFVAKYTSYGKNISSIRISEREETPRDSRGEGSFGEVQGSSLKPFAVQARQWS